MYTRLYHLNSARTARPFGGPGGSSRIQMLHFGAVFDRKRRRDDRKRRRNNRKRRRNNRKRRRFRSFRRDPRGLDLNYRFGLLCYLYSNVTHDPKIQATRNTSYLTVSKSLNGRKIASMAPILTIFGPNRLQRRNLFFEKFRTNIVVIAASWSSSSSPSSSPSSPSSGDFG